MQSKASRLTVISTLVALALLLTACGNSAATPEAPTPLPTTAPISVPPDGQQPANPNAQGPGSGEPNTPLINMGGSATTVDPRFYHFEVLGIPAIPRITERVPCNESAPLPEWVSSFGGSSEPIMSRTDPGRNRLQWCACGLETQELTAKLLFPTEFELEPLVTFTETDTNFCAELRYSYPIDTPPGDYVLTITDSAENILLEDNVTLEAPEGAIVDWVGRDVAWISGFQPGETVLLRYFEMVEQRTVEGNERQYVSYALVDQQNAAIGPDGTLIAQIDVYPVGINVDPTKILVVSGAGDATYTCSPECGVPRGEEPAFEDGLYAADITRLTTYSSIAICEPAPLRACNDNRVLGEQVDEVRVQFDYSGVAEGDTFQQNWAWRPLGDQGTFETWVEYTGCQYEEAGDGTNEISISVEDGLRSGEWLVTMSSDGAVLAQEVFVVEGAYNAWAPPLDDIPCPVPNG